MLPDSAPAPTTCVSTRPRNRWATPGSARIQREVPGASYRRSFTLSDAVDPDRISAGIRNGVLKVELAKAEEVKPRVISIKS